MCNKLSIYKIALASLLGVTALGLTSCEKFLDEKPSKTSSLVVKNTDQLFALLNEYKTFYKEPNSAAIFSTDDYHVSKNLFDARPATFGLINIQFALWDKDYVAQDTRGTYWSNEYTKIFTANLVLSALDQVSGSDSDKATLKADAHFIRAYSYFQLANTYCLPFTEQNRDELGLPLKQSTSFEELDERRPLHEVYALIESDLQEALKTTLSLRQGEQQRHWRSNKAAVNGFAARYYLTRGDYQKALDFAEKSLEDNNALMDYNTDMSYGRSANVIVGTGTPQQKTVTLQFPRTHDNRIEFDLTDITRWRELSYMRFLDHGSWWYVPSQELLALYNQEHDLRFKYHVVEDYSYDRGLINPAYSYPGYVAFFKNALISGITTAEVLLIKAESLARLGRVDDAMTAINTLRAKRLEPGSWVNLSATNQADAIKMVLEERRRELPFTQRWFDLRRLNHNDYDADDVVLTKEFYPYTASVVDRTAPSIRYTLPKGSRRYATPIPETEIISSQGRIVQNKY